MEKPDKKKSSLSFEELFPSWSRQMAALPGSGSDGGSFLLKGSFFSPQSPRAELDSIFEVILRFINKTEMN